MVSGRGRVSIWLTRSRPRASLATRLHRSIRGRGSAVTRKRRGKVSWWFLQLKKKSAKYRIHFLLFVTRKQDI